jgi:hypothetical protein
MAKAKYTIKFQDPALKDGAKFSNVLKKNFLKRFENENEFYATK